MISLLISLFTYYLDAEKMRNLSQNEVQKNYNIILFSSSMNEVTEWFKNFQVESIECTFRGVIETNEVTNLLLMQKAKEE